MPVKVAVYIGRTPPEGGGAFTFEGSVLTALLERASASDHEFVVVGGAGSLLDQAKSAGVETVPLASGGIRRALLKIPRPSVSATRRHQRFTARHGMDSAVVRSGADFLVALGPEVPTLEIPFSVVVWDLQHRLQPFFPEVSAEGVWGRREEYFARVLRRAAFVVAGTEAGRSEIESFYQVSSSRTVVLPHPTPTFALEAGATEAREEMPAHDWNGPFVFYPAQFWPHKNHVTLLKALAMLRDQGGPGCKLVLVGSNWGRNREYVLDRARELGVYDDVVSLGFVAQAELVGLYRHAAALVYPSLFGPENLPPLEAFALGCPVIAAEVPGAREQLGDAALLGNGLDPRFFADAIASVLTSEDARSGLIERGFVRAQRSTPASFADGLIEQLDRFGPVRDCWP